MIYYWLLLCCVPTGISLVAALSACSVCGCDQRPNQVPRLIDCSRRGLQDDFFQKYDLQGNNNDTLSASVMYDVDLSYNALTNVTFMPAIKVQKISFRFNKLTHIASGVLANLTFVSYVDLSHNQLATGALIQDMFRPAAGQMSLPILHLDLSFNKISSIPSHSLDWLTQLQKINLAGNPLAPLDQPTQMAMASLKSLQMLNLANVGLEPGPGFFFSSLPSGLVSLNLELNHLSSLPKELRQLSHLAELNLDGNPVQEISSDFFSGLVGLKKLSISYMPLLKQIKSGAFNSLDTNLVELRLSHNPQLTFIDPRAFESWQPDQIRLKVLSLRNNSLTYLPIKLFEDFNTWLALDQLDLRWNPWACNCHNEWLINELLTPVRNKTPRLTEDLNCGSPAQLTGAPLTSLIGLSLVCDPQDHFNPGKVHFGLTNAAQFRPASVSRMSALVIIGLFVVTISAISVFVAMLIRKHRSSFSSFVPARLRRRRPGGSLDRHHQWSVVSQNTVYRDTTVANTVI